MNLGKRLVRRLGPGDTVCLFGTLGAGKTILVKGMAEGLGISRDEVISPSFVLIREYLPAPLNRKRLRGPAGRGRIKIPFYHFDLFRLRNPQNILSLGYEEYLYGRGICAIEWAQRLAGYLPSEFLKIELRIKDKTKRVIRLIANGERYRKVLKNFKTPRFHQIITR